VSKIGLVFAAAAGVVFGGAASSQAQDAPWAGARAFLDVNVGAQPQRHDATASSSFSLYDEVATVVSSVPVRNGAIVEVGGGYRITRHVAVAAAFSSFGRSSVGTLSASIPDSIFYGQPAKVDAQTAALDHAERAVHVEAVWSAPVSRKVEVSLSAGPSFIHVRQQIATMALPAGAAEAIVATTTETGTAIGANVGFETHYMFAPRFGVGLFVRYAAGSVDLPSVPGLKVGGVRTGLGFRVGL